MGRIPCPFGHGVVFPKGEAELTDLRYSETLRFTPLSVHLIAEHGLYRGRGARYRLSPRALSRFFDSGRQARRNTIASRPCECALRDA